MRNFRTVLNGAVYRGGANNVYNKYGTRGDENPLPTGGLNNLCEEGFGSAIYLYPNNYSSAPHSVSCSSVRGPHNNLKYLQQSPYNASGLHTIFSEVNKAIYNPEHGPVYMHCWNGWHASGLASALVLRQFCGWTPDEAVAYWDKNTDGNDHEANFASIRAAIRDFKPMGEFVLPADTRSRVCLSPDAN